MKYYKLLMDAENENDIVCHFENDHGIEQYDLNVGKVFEGWNDEFEFYYIKKEGDVWTDYLANDKGWFLVSDKLRRILESVNTNIQFITTNVREKGNKDNCQQYHIANIIKVVDALCLEKSTYFETKIDGLGAIYVISKYGIYGDKTEGADVFKLANRQEIPIFVSERFKHQIETEGITGIELLEINVEE